MRDGLSQMKVSSLLEDGRGYIWVGTRSGLNRFNGSEFKIYTQADGLPNDRILALAENSVGEIVILTSQGISIFDGVQFENHLYNFPFVDYVFVGDEEDNFYIHSIQNHIFLNSRNIITVPLESGYFAREDSTGNFLYFKTDTALVYNRGVLRSVERLTHPVRTIHFAYNVLSDSTFGFIPYSDSLVYFNPENRQWQFVRDVTQLHRKSKKLSYVHENIFYSPYGNYQIPLTRPRNMLRVSNGDFLIATEEGLIRFFESAFNSISTEDVPYAWSIVDDENGIYFGNYGYGLIRYDKNEKSFRTIEDNQPTFHCGADRDKNGNLYFSNNHGIGLWKNSNLNFIPGSGSTLHLVFDTLRNQLVSGVHRGIKMISEKGDILSRTHPKYIHNANYIQNITIGPDHSYWCGSYFGLTKYNPDLDSSRHFTDEIGNLPIGPGVFDGCVDHTNRLWLVGSMGLCYFDEQANELLKIHAAELNRAIKSVLELRPGLLLLGAKDQLLTFDIKRFFQDGVQAVQFYNSTNGYDGIEPGYTGFYRDKEKNVWVTSASQTSYLPYPYSLKPNAKLSPFIESINEQKIRYDVSIDSVELYTSDNIVLAIDAIGLDRPTNINYAIRVNGGEWSPWQESGQFILDKLSHGHHRVDAIVGPGSKYELPYASAMICVSLPLYQRAFFLPTLFTILGLFLIMTIYAWWKRREERRQYLVQLEESRYLRSQLLLSELNPHFIFNVLASIQNKILKGDKHEANSKLVQLSSLIRNFLNVSYRSNDPKNRLEHEITLSKEIELLQSYLGFEQMNSNNHFSFKIDIDPTCEPTQIMIPPMLIQPFVENAVKHGVLPNKHPGEIAIHFHYEENALTCVIKDNGLGINTMKSKMRGRQNRKSLGSTIVNDRISVLNQIGYNISLDIVELSVGGTQVTITIYE